MSLKRNSTLSQFEEPRRIFGINICNTIKEALNYRRFLLNFDNLHVLIHSRHCCFIVAYHNYSKVASKATFFIFTSDTIIL